MPADDGPCHIRPSQNRDSHVNNVLLSFFRSTAEEREMDGRIFSPIAFTVSSLVFSGRHCATPRDGSVLPLLSLSLSFRLTRSLPGWLAGWLVGHVGCVRLRPVRHYVSNLASFWPRITHLHLTHDPDEALFWYRSVTTLLLSFELPVPTYLQ